MRVAGVSTVVVVVVVPLVLGTVRTARLAFPGNRELVGPGDPVGPRHAPPK